LAAVGAIVGVGVDGEAAARARLDMGARLTVVPTPVTGRVRALRVERAGVDDVVTTVLVLV